MKTTVGTFRKLEYLLLALSASVLLASCGGGESSSLSGGGTATAGVSVAAATEYPAGTTFAPAPAGLSTPSAPQPAFDNILVTVTKISLLPSSVPEYPDQGGELESQDPPGEAGGSATRGVVTAQLPHPVVFDLLHPPTGRQVARLLNRFPEEIPAGNYSKIRIQYDNVVGVTPDGTVVAFHPTAHYHFDVHFVGGNLIVPVSPDPADGIRFYDIRIHVVGLKYHQAGGSGNVLLRPQVFATVGAAKYLVSGVAQEVNSVDRTFKIRTAGGTIVPAAHEGTTAWVYSDDTVIPARRNGMVGEILGDVGLRDGAIVNAIGTFSPSRILLAEGVDITFPDVLAGSVSVGWKIDNTFDLRLLTVDNTVFPMPGRMTAYYDNAVDSARLFDTNLFDNAAITARGYRVAGGIDAFWISIAP
jgi:hypothetical protein